MNGSELSLVELLSLEGKIAVVTGGASGIGAALVRRFHEAGAQVVSLDKRRSGHPFRERILEFELDVTNDVELQRVINSVANKFGAVDVYVNNAGAAPRAAAVEMALAQWDAVINLNLRAAFAGAQAAAAQMMRQKGGVIINMLSSCVGHVGGNPAHYRAAKAGLNALSQSMAVELGRYGIRVLGVAPTLTETEQVQELRRQGFAQGLDKFASSLPLGRACTPDEVARVCVFAASSLASFMTGTNLFVDGGETAK
jgi:NAD(P)-dependent dehydrogenase (short-subunit alcohol dehydrogenase family)